MKMNYNKWFYSYHKYLKGEDNEYLEHNHLGPAVNDVNNKAR